MSLTNFEISTWWVRWYLKVVVTEEGIFGEDQVPDDYAGSQLEMELLMYVVVATKAGYTSIVKYGDWTEVMDKTRNKGVGIGWQPHPALFDEFEQTDPKGPSTKYLAAYWKENADFAEQREKLVQVSKALRANATL